jgi:hypothetical protein
VLKKPFAAPRVSSEMRCLVRRSGPGKTPFNVDLVPGWI